MTIKELKLVVDELNSSIPESVQDSIQFYFSYTHYIESIGIYHNGIEILLWHSEDDQREIIESSGEYEPLIDHIKKQYLRNIQELSKVTFDVEIKENISSYKPDQCEGLAEYCENKLKESIKYRPSRYSTQVQVIAKSRGIEVSRQYIIDVNTLRKFDKKIVDIICEVSEQNKKKVLK